MYFNLLFSLQIRYYKCDIAQIDIIMHVNSIGP